MLPSTEIEFDEFALAIIDGYQCGIISGLADVQYGTEGEWSIVGIALDGWKLNPDEGPIWLPNENKWLPKAHPLYGVIQSTLETRYADKINEQVSDCILADQVASPFNHADHYRGLRLVQAAE